MIKFGIDKLHVDLALVARQSEMNFSSVFIWRFLLVIMVDRKDKQISDLHNELDILHRRINTNNYALRNQKDDNIDLRNQIINMRRERDDLLNQNRVLQDQLNRMRENLRQFQRESHALRPVQIYKRWSDIKSKAKLKRKLQYRDMIDKSMRYVTECKRAKLTLRIDNEDVDLKWSEEDMDKHRIQLGIINDRNDTEKNGNTPNRNDTNDQIMNNNIDNTDNDNENYNDNDNTQDINMDEGFEYTPKYLGQIITWMDDHRISHRAYDSMKHIFQGHIPSLNQVIKRKNQMSVELPFIAHQAVFGIFKIYPKNVTH